MAGRIRQGRGVRLTAKKKGSSADTRHYAVTLLITTELRTMREVETAALSALASRQPDRIAVDGVTVRRGHCCEIGYCAERARSPR